MDDMFIRIIVIAVVGVEVFFVMKHGCPDFQNLDGGLTRREKSVCQALSALDSASFDLGFLFGLVNDHPSVWAGVRNHMCLMQTRSHLAYAL